MNNKIKIEAIAESVNDVNTINKIKDVDRIELVSDLSKGGLSPTIDVVKKSCEETNIPIYVMVRLHDNGFVYSREEFREMKRQITEIKKTCAKGIVFGSLSIDGNIDEKQLQKVIEVSKPLKLTFHRAVDNSINYLDSIKVLNKYEIENILTSGGKSNAFEGIDNIKKAIDISIHNIMPGSGINYNNIDIFNKLKIKFLHFGLALKQNGEISKKNILDLRKRMP